VGEARLYCYVFEIILGRFCCVCVAGLGFVGSLAALGFHALAQDAVDRGLVAWSLPAQPVEHIHIDAEADGFLAGFPEFAALGVLPVFGGGFGDVVGVRLAAFEGAELGDLVVRQLGVIRHLHIVAFLALWPVADRLL